MLSFIRRLHVLLVAGTIIAMFLIAGCSRSTLATARNYPNNGFWAGRISLQVQSEPAQSFHAGFELKGRPESGELTLISPLGSILGVLRWSPSEAVLDSGDQKIQRFDSVDALMAQATGAAIPLSALFAWLHGDNASVSGWTADLSRQAEGRITAKRLLPAPEAALRVVLDR
ncbi:MAG: outer membrane lipoprotein LolB [Polaromonas sp.]